MEIMLLKNKDQEMYQIKKRYQAQNRDNIQERYEIQKRYQPPKRDNIQERYEIQKGINLKKGMNT